MLRAVLSFGLATVLAACLPVWERYEDTGAVYTYEGTDYRVIRGYASVRDGQDIVQLLLFPATQNPRTYDGRLAVASCGAAIPRACATAFGQQLRMASGDAREDSGMGY